MEKYIITAALSLASIAFAALTWYLCWLKAEKIAQSDALLRNNFYGGILAAGALAWCAPHVQAVAWYSLVPWVWPLAVLALILSVKYLDNLLPRAFAGLLIMGAYSFLDMSFDYRLGMYVSGALVPWVWGAVGIVIAAKPCYLRDFLRLCAQKKFWRYLTGALTAVTALFLLATIAIFWKVQG